MIKAILFDLRETLITVDPAFKATDLLTINFLKSKRINLTNEEFADVNAKAVKEMRKRLEGSIAVHDWSKEILLELFKLLNLKLKEEQFQEFLSKFHKIFADRVEVYDDALWVLRKLKKINLKTGVIIDGTIDRESAILKRLGLNKLLSVVVISEEVGLNKFTRKPFEEALKRLQEKPQNVIMVGDRLDKDIANANNVGMLSVKLNRNKTRFASPEKLMKNQKPNFEINTLTELPTILDLVG